MLLISNLDEEARLVEVSDSLAISTGEVLGDCHLSIIPGESGVGGSPFEVHIFNMVGPLVTPVCNDRATSELLLHNLSELIFSVGVALDIANSVQTGGR